MKLRCTRSFHTSEDRVAAFCVMHSEGGALTSWEALRGVETEEVAAQGRAYPRLCCGGRSKMGPMAF